MLYLEIQEKKANMQKLAFFSELGATAACTKRLLVAAGLMGSGVICIGDSWFASLKTALALLAIGIVFIGNVKTATKNFPKAVLSGGLLHGIRGDQIVMTADDEVGIVTLHHGYSNRKFDTP